MALTDSRIRLALPVLFLAAWLVYHPALNRVFTADQVWYFAELNGDTSLVEGLRRIDYAVSRHYWKGDESLFRPLLFAWLAVENSLFSYHHIWWNIANLSLHSLVAFFLFRLLITIRRTWWALPAALLFDVLKPPLELVAWNHLGGYLFACMFLAIGVRAFTEILAGREQRRRWSAVFAVSFTAAGLFYETMVPISLLAAALILVVERHRGRPCSGLETLALLTPVLIFTGLYLVHIQYVARLFYVDSPDATEISAVGRVVNGLADAFGAARTWCLELLFPSGFLILPGAFDRFQTSFSFGWRSSANLRDIVLFALALAVAAGSVSWKHLQRSLPLLMLLAGSLFLSAFVICLGRPLSLVLSAGYYPYLPGLLLTAFCYALIDFDRLHRWKAMLGGGVLAALIAAQAIGTYAVTREIGRVNNDASRLLVRVSRFVDAHKSEPGFTFVIRAHLQNLDPPIALLRGYPDDPSASTEIRRFTQIIFKRYYDEVRPKYVFEQSER